MPGALTFGAATSDVVDIGSGASIDDLDPFTVLLWVNVTTITSQRALYCKIGTGQKLFRLSGTGGDVQLIVTRAGNTTYTTNSTPLSATGVWLFIAASFKSTASAGQIVNIYKGTLSTLAAECTYGTATDGSGAPTSDASGTARFGNNSTNTSAFQGAIGPAAIVGAELTLAEVQSWQQIPRLTVGANVAKAFLRLGNEGVGAQQDYSGNGNTGTVTGATQSDGPPLSGPWVRSGSLYRMAA